MITAICPPAFELARMIDVLSVRILTSKKKSTMKFMPYELSCSSIVDTLVQKSLSRSSLCFDTYTTSEI